MSRTYRLHDQQEGTRSWHYLGHYLAAAAVVGGGLGVAQVPAARPERIVSSQNQSSADIQNEWERLEDMVRTWEDEVRGLSSPKALFQHPAFEAIIGSSETAVPFLIDRLKKKPSLLVEALRRIYPSLDPVAPEDRGNLQAVVTAWIRRLEPGYKHSLMGI